MADIRDAMLAEEAALDSLNLIDEEAPIEKVVALGFVAVTRAILAVGTRLDYVVSRAVDVNNSRS